VANCRSRPGCSMTAEVLRGRCFLMRSNPLRTFHVAGDSYKSAASPGRRHRGGIMDRLRSTPLWRNSLVSSGR
jgi:hypothetical protein